MTTNLIEKGKSHFEKRELDQALKIFNDVLDQEPNNVQALYFRSLCLRHTDQLELSLADLNKAISIVPNDADLFSERGVAHIHLKDPLSALSDMEKALELDTRAYRYCTRAFVKNMLKDTEGAIADYEKAIELDPEDDVAHNNLSMLQESMGWKDKAKETANKADELAKQNRPEEKFQAKKVDRIKAERINKIEKDFVEKVMKNENPLPPVNTEGIKIEEKEMPSMMNIIKGVFLSKSERKAFVNFILNGFKLPKED